MASDSVRSGPTNYEDSTPERASETFAYRSPNKNPFLRFAYPRVKNEFLEKWPFLDENYGLTLLKKCQFFDFFKLLFL